MRIRVVKPAELSLSELRRWSDLQRAHPQLGSPYFAAEFARAVGAVCDDARVAVLEDRQRPVGFFPFQRGRLGIGKPIGRSLSDFQAVVAAPDTPFDAQQLLRGAGLAVWEFDHLLATAAAFRPFQHEILESPVIDLSSGFAAYAAQRRAAGSERIAQLQRKKRKLEREVGGVEFVAHCADAAVLDHVVRAKSAQCRRTGAFDFFAELSWTVPLLRHILAVQTPEFAGILSVLRAGGRIAAAHFGMRSARRLHWWFPVYDPDGDLAVYSPGGILLLELAQHAADTGLQALDLGKGEDAYKRSFMTGAVAIAEGAVETASWPALLRRTRIQSRQWLRRATLLAPLRHGVRRVRAMRGR